MPQRVEKVLKVKGTPTPSTSKGLHDKVVSEGMWAPFISSNCCLAIIF